MKTFLGISGEAFYGDTESSSLRVAEKPTITSNIKNDECNDLISGVACGDLQSFVTEGSLQGGCAVEEYEHQIRMGKHVSRQNGKHVCRQTLQLTVKESEILRRRIGDQERRGDSERICKDRIWSRNIFLFHHQSTSACVTTTVFYKGFLPTLLHNDPSNNRFQSTEGTKKSFVLRATKERNTVIRHLDTFE
uniref:Uncharacterized protein n=1 Tax=Onchocerca volvulus TaxID=6282 RepID=A0A8R1Y550_ONCVO